MLVGRDAPQLGHAAAQLLGQRQRAVHVAVAARDVLDHLAGHVVAQRRQQRGGQLGNGLAQQHLPVEKTLGRRVDDALGERFFHRLRAQRHIHAQALQPLADHGQV